MGSGYVFLAVFAVGSLVIDISEMIVYAKGRLQVVPFFILQLIKTTIWLMVLVLQIVFAILYTQNYGSHNFARSPLALACVVAFVLIS